MVTTKPIPEFSEIDVARFWAKVRIAGPDECWEWTGCINPNGYGHLTRRGKILKAHRVAYFLTHGPFPEERPFAMHSCDNRPCCNPAHLSPCTYAENIQDKQNKGRGNQAKGERCSKAKLTNEQVLEIRQIHQTGTMSQRAIGRRFNVSHNAILAITKGKYWTHI